MFGETSIIGSKTIALDKKNRIIIPKFTGAEPKDRIITRLNFYQNKLFIQSVDDYMSDANRFEELLLEQKEKGKLNAADIRQYRRFFYGSLSSPDEELDSQRRFTLFPHFVQKLKLYESVFVIGKDTHLELYPNEETYYILNAKQK